MSTLEEQHAAYRHLSAREGLLTRPVALVGFMGVGKTSVGRELARLLGRPFVDTDPTVEQRSGRSITALFQAGEHVFRDWEFLVLTELLDPLTRPEAGAPAVIALGGGAFAQPRCAQLLLERAVVVQLYTPWSVMLGLLDELAADRPLIRDREAWQVQELFLARAASYRRAHLRVNLPRQGARQAAESVAALLRASSR